MNQLIDWTFDCHRQSWSMIVQYIQRLQIESVEYFVCTFIWIRFVWKFSLFVSIFFTPNFCHHAIHYMYGWEKKYMLMTCIPFSLMKLHEQVQVTHNHSVFSPLRLNRSNYYYLCYIHISDISVHYNMFRFWFNPRCFSLHLIFSSSVVCGLYDFILLLISLSFRLSTKSLLNLSTKTPVGHALKHGYVSMPFIIITNIDFFFALNCFFSSFKFRTKFKFE